MIYDLRFKNSIQWHKTCHCLQTIRFPSWDAYSQFDLFSETNHAINNIYFFLSSWATAEFNKSCNPSVSSQERAQVSHPSPYSRRNLSCWFMFVIRISGDRQSQFTFFTLPSTIDQHKFISIQFKLPLVNLIECFEVVEVLKFSHSWHNGLNFFLEGMS